LILSSPFVTPGVFIRGRKTMSYKSDKIRQLAGTLSVIDIADLMGMSKKAVEKIAYNERISLSLNAVKLKKPEDDLLKARKLEKASELLRQNGYKVFLPCPFRDYADAR